MDVWRLSPGDQVRLPCWPGDVEVTDADLAEGMARSGYWTRVHWEAPAWGAEGSTVLPDELEVALLASPDPSKAVHLDPEPGPEAGG